MPKSRVTRRTLLAGAAPLVAAGPLAKLAFAEDPQHLASHRGREHARAGHAAMIGDQAPAPGGPNDLDALLMPPPALPHQPGRVREYSLRATDRDVEIAPGIFFPAWTYNGTVPGPVIRATEDDILRVDVHERRLAPAHDPLPRHPPGEHGRRLRDRRVGSDVRLRVPGQAVRDAPLPLPLDTAEEAHPQGPLRRLHHRPARAAQARAGARHGDERLRHRRRRRKQLLHRQRPQLLLREVPDHRAAARRPCASTSPT